MRASMTKKLMLGAAAATVAMLGALAPAAAKGGHHHRHFHRFHGPVYIYGSGGCDYYRYKYQQTGSTYWKVKYLDCIS